MDNEIEGVGNNYTAEYWQYSSRLGRRWNIDPELKQYSRYSTFANNPLKFRDPIGRDTLSFTGSNGRKIMFIHKSLPKMDVNFPLKLNIDNDVTVNFDKTGDGILPDVIGYSLTVSGNAAAGSRAVSGSVSKNFAIFTRGKYKYQPFSYSVIGAKAGYEASGTASADLTGTLSIFGANWTGKLSKMNPTSWAGGFKEVSANASGFAGYGGGLGATYFESSSFEGGGYKGFSFDISVGIGGGSEDGAGVSATLMGGGSYYFLNEIYPTETLKLMSSNIGKARLYAKWSEFLTGGIVPGTSISDGLHIIENTSFPKSRPIPQYNSPTMLNGMMGSGNKL